MQDLEKHLKDLKDYLIKVIEEENSFNEGSLNSEITLKLFNVVENDIKDIKEWWYEEN